MITIDDVKLMLPDDLLGYLTDESGSGVIDDEKLQFIVDNANSYFESKFPEAKEAVRDEWARNYTIAKLYEYIGNVDMAQTYHDMWKTEAEYYFTEQRLEVLKQKNVTSENKIIVSSNDRYFTDDILEWW